MPLAGTQAILGVALQSATGTTDGAGAIAWLGVANAICTWLPANCAVNPGAMIAASGAVTGFGTLAFTDATSFGKALAAGAGSTDSKGIEKWTNIGKAIVAHLTNFGQVNPNLFVSIPVTGGAVTGTGLVQFSNAVLGPFLSASIAASDLPALAIWMLLGTVIVSHLVANTLVLASSFTSPPVGPLVGTGKIL